LPFALLTSIRLRSKCGESVMAVGLTCEAVHKSMSENYDPQTQKRHPKVPFFLCCLGSSILKTVVASFKSKWPMMCT
jgi:hypothetical protein